MPDFNSLQLPEAFSVLAPDGSEVRVLLGLQGGGMAHFQLAPGQVSAAVTHRSVEEIWFVVSGAGQMWRRQGQREEVTELVPGLCLTIPLGTAFQFRAAATSPLAAVAITMPPWPGEDEAILVAGPWQPGRGQEGSECS
ncbi:MAG: cupin domain-containing protein [Burkholderiaceae bacterium]|nr:cupin domain-containing protein [Burkholderiaceae bacterium]